MKSPRFSAVEMTEIVLPQHTNALGTVFGGVVLSWVDVAAAICAQRHCERIVVTAAIDAMHFLAPIKLGWIVTIKAVMTATAKTSCEIEVTVIAENPMARERHHTASAYVSMVALDSHGRPTTIPPLQLETPEDRVRSQQAQERRQARLDMRARVLAHATTSPAGEGT